MTGKNVLVGGIVIMDVTSGIANKLEDGGSEEISIYAKCVYVLYTRTCLGYFAGSQYKSYKKLSTYSHQIYVMRRIQ